MGLPTIAVPEYSLTVPSSGNQIKFRPFLVKEEKILLIAMESENPEEIINATKTIVKNCVYGDIDVDTLPTFDLEYIFLQLRGKAKGEQLELNYKCPKCEAPIPVLMNVDDIKVQKDENHTNNIKFTEQLGVVMKYPDIILQNTLEKIAEENKVDALFQTIIHCIDYIYDEHNTYPAKDHNPKELEEFVESLTDDYFQKISNFFETMPKLQHKTLLKCENKVKSKGKNKETKACGYKEELVLEGLASFFD